MSRPHEKPPPPASKALGPAGPRRQAVRVNRIPCRTIHTVPQPGAQRNRRMEIDRCSRSSRSVTQEEVGSSPHLSALPRRGMDPQRGN